MKVGAESTEKYHINIYTKGHLFIKHLLNVYYLPVPGLALEFVRWQDICPALRSIGLT